MMRFNIGLLLMFGFVFFCSAGVEETLPVKWEDDVFFEYYLPGKATKKEEFSGLLEKIWNKDIPITVVYNKKAGKKIRDCNELLSNDVMTVKPSSQNKLIIVHALKVNCYVLKTVGQLESSNISYVSHEINRLAHEIIKMKIESAMPDIEYSFSGKRKVSDVECVRDNKCYISTSDGEVYKMVGLLYGDYNGDKIEDIVMSISFGSLEGINDTTDIAIILTRKSEGGQLELLHMYLPYSHE